MIVVDSRVLPGPIRSMQDSTVYWIAAVGGLPGTDAARLIARRIQNDGDQTSLVGDVLEVARPNALFESPSSNDSATRLIDWIRDRSATGERRPRLLLDGPPELASIAWEWIFHLADTPIDHRVSQAPAEALSDLQRGDENPGFDSTWMIGDVTSGSLRASVDSRLPPGQYAQLCELVDSADSQSLLVCHINRDAASALPWRDTPAIERSPWLAGEEMVRAVAAAPPDGPASPGSQAIIAGQFRQMDNRVVVHLGDADHAALLEPLQVAGVLTTRSIGRWQLIETGEGVMTSAVAAFADQLARLTSVPGGFSWRETNDTPPWAIGGRYAPLDNAAGSSWPATYRTALSLPQSFDWTDRVDRIASGGQGPLVRRLESAAENRSRGQMMRLARRLGQFNAHARLAQIQAAVSGTNRMDPDRTDEADRTP